MWHLCFSIWQKKEWPLGWCRAVFVPLPKKDNLKECANHRTIICLSFYGLRWKRFLAQYKGPKPDHLYRYIDDYIGIATNCSETDITNFITQWRSQPHSPGWARLLLSSFFLKFPSLFSYFSLYFPCFCPHFGAPGGRLAHPGTPWLRYCHHCVQRFLPIHPADPRNLENQSSLPRH